MFQSMPVSHSVAQSWLAMRRWQPFDFQREARLDRILREMERDVGENPGNY